MALPAHLVDRFSPALTRALHLGKESGRGVEDGIRFGLPALDELLKGGGLLRGGVVELSLAEGVPGTSLMLALCRSAQQQALQAGREVPWCAFVDPGASLHGPGVARAQVRCDRLLVVRPSVEAIARTTVRLAKSAAFELVVVDLLGVRGAALPVALHEWPRIVRRLALEVDASARSVVLLTDADARRALPLPVAQRLEIARPALDRLIVRVAKDKRGYVTASRPVAWSRPEGEALVEEWRHASAG
ncbi:MAG TPA: recombinase A [Polyangiaceae bacterium]|nr:recombinase A [Polyangiaceae bacterium]